MELNVTPAAVSQQIRTLENLLSVQLYPRFKKGLTLTSAGKSGLSQLQDGLRNVNDAIVQIRSEPVKTSLDVWMAAARVLQDNTLTGIEIQSSTERRS